MLAQCLVTSLLLDTFEEILQWIKPDSLFSTFTPNNYSLVISGPTQIFDWAWKRLKLILKYVFNIHSVPDSNFANRIYSVYRETAVNSRGTYHNSGCRIVLRKIWRLKIKYFQIKNSIKQYIIIEKTCKLWCIIYKNFDT